MKGDELSDDCHLWVFDDLWILLCSFTLKPLTKLCFYCVSWGRLTVTAGASWRDWQCFSILYSEHQLPRNPPVISVYVYVILFNTHPEHLKRCYFCLLMLGSFMESSNKPGASWWVGVSWRSASLTKGWSCFYTDKILSVYLRRATGCHWLSFLVDTSLHVSTEEWLL